MKNKKIILDTSTIVNGLTNEDKKIRKKFFRLLKNNNCLSSTLTIFEFNNAIGKIYRTDLASRLLLVDKFFILNIELLTINESIVEKAHQISSLIFDSFYDASYHALALYEDAIFVTADKRYYEKAKRFGNIEYFLKGIIKLTTS